MSILFVEGTYMDGKVELDERPAGVASATRVMVAIPMADQAGAEPAVDPARRQEAIRFLVEKMKAGLDLGGPPYPKRDELHDRHER